MEKYLPKFTSSLDKNQRIEFQRILDQRVAAGEISQEDVDLGRADVAVSGGGAPVTEVPVLEDKIKSVVYNETMKSIMVDLRALYKESNITAYTISRNAMINKDIVSIMRSRLNRIAAKIISIKAIAIDKSSSARAENFYDSPRMEFDGTTLSPDNTITLAAHSSSKTYNTGSNIRLVEKVVLPLGSNIDTVPYPDQNLLYDYNRADSDKRNIKVSTTSNREMMAKGVGDIFWRETILADRPVTHTWEGTQYDGVLVGITIHFTKPRDITSVVIDPFTDRDLDIYRIAYKGQDGDFHSCRFNDDAMANAKGNTSMHIKNIVNATRTDAIQVWFLQRNFRKRNILVDGNTFYEWKIWSDLLAGEYADIASKFAPDEITNMPRDIIIDAVKKSRAYDDAGNNILESDDPDKSLREALNLDPKDDIFLEKYEYELGAYSIEPQTLLYNGADFGTFTSHKEGDGYIADVRAVTEITLNAELDTPALTSVELYVVDQEERVEIPIVPQGTITWKERVFPTGISNDDFVFETTFPATSGSLTLFRNGVDVDDNNQFDLGTLTQTDALGSVSSSFSAAGFLFRNNDIFVATYDIQHDNRAYSTQRRASVVTLRDEIPPSIVSDSTTEGTIARQRNVATLSRFPYIQTGECNTDTSTFPFTSDSVSLAVFNLLAQGDQRELDWDGFIPYMKVEQDEAPGDNMILYQIVNESGNYYLTFTTAQDPGIIEMKSEASTGDDPDGVTVVKELYANDGVTRVGEIRIDWSNVAVFENTPSPYYNVFIAQSAYEPPTLGDAILWPSRYGTGAVIRSEVMGGILFGEDLSSALGSLTSVFASTTCPILVAVNDVVAIDKTSYQRPYQVPMDDYSVVGEFQYFINGRNIYFNTDFDQLVGDFRIDAIYWHLTKAVKLRAKLRANQRNLSKLTPILKNYIFKFRSQ